MRKRSVWLIIAAVVAVIVLSFAFLIDKVTVSASSIALSDQGWKANFSEPLKASAILDGTIYLVDQQGKKTNAHLALTQNGRSVEVSEIKPGSYICTSSGKLFKVDFSNPCRPVNYRLQFTKICKL